MSDTTIILQVPLISTESNPGSDQVNARILLHELQEGLRLGLIPAGYTTACCHFDGAGDSTNDMEWKLGSPDVNLPDRPLELRAVQGNKEDRYQFDTWVWNISFDRAGGWYNNEGGYGELIVNFVEGRVHFEMFEAEQTHNQTSDESLINLETETYEQERVTSEVTGVPDDEGVPRDPEVMKAVAQVLMGDEPVSLDQAVQMAVDRHDAAAAQEPSWLFHAHYGDAGTPLTVYDNHDGTYTMLDGQSSTIVEGSAEQTLREFTSKINSLVLSSIKMEG